MFCSYLTTYHGDKLPRYYVGSSSVEKVENGYHGTVKSVRYEDVWNKELQENPHLFETTILTLHSEREDATQEELRFQKENDVVRSDEWINQAYAQPNGFFGRDVSGELNPNYGNGSGIKNYYENLSDSEWEQLRERNRNSGFKQWENAPERKEKTKKVFKKTIQQWRKDNPEKYSELQRNAGKQGAIGLRNKCIHLSFEGSVYQGYAEFERETGITKWYAKKMVETGEIKVVKNG